MTTNKIVLCFSSVILVCLLLSGCYPATCKDPVLYKHAVKRKRLYHTTKTKGLFQPYHSNASKPNTKRSRLKTFSQARHTPGIKDNRSIVS